MKKVLLGLLVAGFCSVVNAATTSSTLSLNGNLASSCTSGFSNGGTLNFTFLPGAQAPAQIATYTLTCTAGSIISAFTATSANGWDFKGISSNDLINYSISSVTAAPYSASVATTWSGATTVTTPTDLLASGSITIDGSAAPLISTLTIIPVTTPVASNADAYSDTVTVATAY